MLYGGLGRASLTDETRQSDFRRIRLSLRRRRRRRRRHRLKALSSPSIRTDVAAEGRRQDGCDVQTLTERGTNGRPRPPRLSIHIERKRERGKSSAAKRRGYLTRKERETSALLQQRHRGCFHLVGRPLLTATSKPRDAY